MRLWLDSNCLGPACFPTCARVPLSRGKPDKAFPERVRKGRGRYTGRIPLVPKHGFLSPPHMALKGIFYLGQVKLFVLVIHLGDEGCPR